MPPMKPRAHPDADPSLADTLSPAVVARRWNIPLAAVRELLASGELDFCQIAGKLRVPRAAVEALELQSPQLVKARQVRKHRRQ